MRPCSPCPAPAPHTCAPHSAAQVLLLDEPTNPLDMDMIDSLALAIKKFAGGIILVSHDFRLLEQVAT